MSITCDTCKGTAQIEATNPAGTSVAMLVAKRIVEEYPHLKSWESIYTAIVVNISNAVNVSTTSALWRKQRIEDPMFSLDEVFAEKTLPIDTYLNQMIDTKNLLHE